MAAFTSVTSGNFSSNATWGTATIGACPNADNDTFVISANNNVTYDITVPVNEGLGSSNVAPGGTLTFLSNTRLRMNQSLAVNGNFFANTNVEIYLKGTTSADFILDFRSFNQRTTTATGTSGQNTITLADANSAIVGCRVSGTGVNTSPGAIVTAVNTTSRVVTLSANNTGTVSGTLTIGNVVRLVGSEGMPITNVNTAITSANNQQGFIVVANTQPFANNDWIAIFKRDYSNVYTERNDEGYLIYDIDSSANTIYLKEFVGPIGYVLGVNNNIITVDNSKIFREWQKLIFGTNANRNIHSITSIDYQSNQITLANNVTGNTSIETNFDATNSVVGLASMIFDGVYREIISTGNIGILPLPRPTVNTSINITSLGDNKGVIAIGYFKPPTTGTYTFKTISDDTSGVWIGDLASAFSGRTANNAIVNNNMDFGISGGTSTGTATGSINLEANTCYPIRIVSEEGFGGERITFAWSGPGIAETNDLSEYYRTPAIGGSNTTTAIVGDFASGSIIRKPVYTTGPLKTHGVGNKVRKVATTVAQHARSTNTSLVLSSVSGFNVDDEILVDSRWIGDASYTDERPEKRNITAISGNTITLNSALGYEVMPEAFVVRLTRDLKIIGDYETTLTMSSVQTLTAGDRISQDFSRASGFVKSNTSSSTTVVLQDCFGEFVTGTTNDPRLSRNGTLLASNVSVSSRTINTANGHCQLAFNRGLQMTTNHLGRLDFRDVECTTFSNQNSTSSRLWIRGQWSSATQNTGCEIEGITWATPSQTDNFNFSTRRFTLQRFHNDATARCCAVWNTEGGIFADEGYNLQNLGIFNNYSARAEAFGYIIQHLTFDWEAAYNYAHRADDIGVLLNVARFAGRGFHHNWLHAAQGRAIQSDVSYGSIYPVFQNKFERTFTPFNATSGFSLSMIYNYFDEGTHPLDFTIDIGFHNHNFSAGMPFYMGTSLEHNFNIDGVAIYIPNGVRYWDSVEGSWRVYNDRDSGAIQTGYEEVIYVPPNTTLKAQGTIKLYHRFNGAPPVLRIRTTQDRFVANTPSTLNTWTSLNQQSVGNLANTSFSATPVNAYQTVEATLPAVSWGRQVTVGIINLNSNAAEGWWERPIRILYDPMPATPFLQVGNLNLISTIDSGTSFNQKKIRLGGRLI